MNRPGEKKSLADIENDVVHIVNLATGKTIDRTMDNLEPMDLDSLTRLEIVTMIEKKFPLTLTEDVTGQFKSISRIARIILYALEARSAADR